MYWFTEITKSNGKCELLCHSDLIDHDVPQGRSHAAMHWCIHNVNNDFLGIIGVYQNHFNHGAHI